MKLPLLTLLFSQLLFAYPEMVRNGYVNCTTCHVSPNGGGLLTAYGRSLSREVLSQAGSEKETRWMYFAEPPEWLQLGGDVRVIQTYIDTPTYRQARLIWMQMDAEVGVTIDNFQFVGTLGKSGIENAPTFSDSFVSRRHYLMWKPTDEISVRGGRFFPAFGILLADHTLATRRGLGFDQGNETFNLEMAYLGESFDAFVTGIAGRPDKPETMRERGVAIRSAINFKESYKLGAGYYFGHSERGDKHAFGPFGILGFQKNFFALVELDLVKNQPGNRDSTTGLAHYGRLNYEILQGIHFYVTEDVFKTDVKDPSTTVNSYGVGIQWFPRPHFEFIAQYQKTKIWSIDSDNYNDYIWLQFHFYP